MIIFLLQLTLCLSVGLSNICFGMEKQETWNIFNVTHPHHFNVNLHSKNMTGKLQIYHAKKHTNEFAAQLIPTNGPIIKFSNFHDISDQQKNIFFHNKLQLPLNIPVHIYGDDGCEKDIVVTKVEELNKSEELLNIPEFQVRVHADNIEVYKNKEDSPIVLRNPENIGIVHQALFSGKSFMVDFMENNKVTQGRVKSYSNGIRFLLNNFISSWSMTESSYPRGDWNCLKMSFPLNNNERPEMIFLDLNKEEKPHSYQIGKWAGAGVLAMVLAVVVYKLRDKAGMLGDFLLQSTKLITNMETPSAIE